MVGPDVPPPPPPPLPVTPGSWGIGVGVGRGGLSSWGGVWACAVATRRAQRRTIRASARALLSINSRLLNRKLTRHSVFTPVPDGGHPPFPPLEIRHLRIYVTDVGLHSLSVNAAVGAPHTVRLVIRPSISGTSGPFCRLVIRACLAILTMLRGPGRPVFWTH